MPEKLFNPDYLKHLCQKYGLVPSKKYGQNFLINEEPINKMIEAAAVGPNDTVVEIGPGFGALTFALAAKAKKVTAFEIEKKLTPYWDEQLQRNKNIEIVWGNVLTSLSLRGVASDEAISSPGDRHASLAMTAPYKVIANLPYQITSEVIRKFLEMKNKPEVMVFMVQKEVAERICAKPSLPGEAGKRSRGDMSVLAVSVQLYAEPEIIMQVPRSSFWPEPKVDSAVIKIRIKNPRPHPNLLLKGEGVDEPSPVRRGQGEVSSFNQQFFKIVKAGFANRRKMLIKNLSSIITKDKLKTIFAEIGLDEKVRAQELSVEQWKQLFAKLSF